MWHEPVQQMFKTRYLVAGEVFVTGKPTLITTVLGSCVAVCLWDPSTGLGGMNHFMLPRWDGKGLASNRFGDVAIRSLIRKMSYLGANPRSIQAHVFGGASPLGLKKSKHQAGRGNVAVAFEVLEREGIAVVESKVGGPEGRKVMFNTASGTAIVRPVGHRAFQSVERL
jgi:chemotaxis protein CheD